LKKGLRMVSGISSSGSTLAVPSKAPANNPVAAKQIAGADRALNALMNDSGVIQSLSDATSTYLPPSFGQIQSLLWGVMNANGDPTITKTELEKAVRLDGGATSDADALWVQLNAGSPNANSPTARVTSQEFASNAYLAAAVLANVSAEQDAVSQSQIQAQAEASNGNNLLAYMFGGSSGSTNIFS
jgi:hypothetical protein